jgi:hypothetical protein
MMVKLNLQVLETLEKIKPLEPGRSLTLTNQGNNFQLFYKGEQIAILTLTDLRTISQQAARLNIVQLVDVSHLVFSGHIKITDAYLKIEDDMARGFLHLIRKMKFQNPTNTTAPGMVAV